MTRAARLWLWLLPPCFFLALYWRGLFVWFQADDFGWMGIADSFAHSRDVWTTFFAPKAQGSIRPITERLYFFALFNLFGFNGLPYRLCAYITQMANVVIFAAVARKLTGSNLAAVAAPILWCSNLALFYPLSWNSVYNQVAWAFIFLLAFYFLLRYLETGRRAFWIAQWAVFLLGFGVLELNVVYPALAFSYCWLFARDRVRMTLPLFLPSILFTIVHRVATRNISVPGYGLYWDVSIFRSLWTYWRWAFNTTQYYAFSHVPEVWGVVAFWILSLSLLAFVAVQAKQRKWLPAFGLVWFLATLAPVLPLRDHLTEYYPAIPAIGLSLTAAIGIAAAWNARWPLRAAGLVLVTTYMLAGIKPLRTSLRRSVETTLRIEALVGGVARAQRLHPGKTILLSEIDEKLFWLGVSENPFRLLGIDKVYMVPETSREIRQRPNFNPVTDYVLPAATTLAGLDRGTIVVYSAKGPRLKNVTALYEAKARATLVDEFPRRLDAGGALFTKYFVEGWYPPANGTRWMAKRGALRIGGPRSAGERLWISGFRPEHSRWTWPVELRAAVEGRPLQRHSVGPRDGQFQFDYALPAELAGRASIEIVLEVDRTFSPPEDRRSLGLAFSVFEVR